MRSKRRIFDVSATPNITEKSLVVGTVKAKGGRHLLKALFFLCRGGGQGGEKKKKKWRRNPTPVLSANDCGAATRGSPRQPLKVEAAANINVAHVARGKAAEANNDFHN